MAWNIAGHLLKFWDEQTWQQPRQAITKMLSWLNSAASALPGVCTLSDCGLVQSAACLCVQMLHLHCIDLFPMIVHHNIKPAMAVDRILVELQSMTDFSAEARWLHRGAETLQQRSRHLMLSSHCRSAA